MFDEQTILKNKSKVQSLIKILPINVSEVIVLIIEKYQHV
jgi:hypothetical protein